MDTISVYIRKANINIDTEANKLDELMQEYSAEGLTTEQKSELAQEIVTRTTNVENDKLQLKRFYDKMTPKQWTHHITSLENKQNDIMKYNNNRHDNGQSKDLIDTANALITAKLNRDRSIMISNQRRIF
jgi:hypothetical protein